MSQHTLWILRPRLSKTRCLSLMERFYALFIGTFIFVINRGEGVVDVCLTQHGNVPLQIDGNSRKASFMATNCGNYDNATLLLFVKRETTDPSDGGCCKDMEIQDVKVPKLPYGSCFVVSKENITPTVPKRYFQVQTCPMILWIPLGNKRPVELKYKQEAEFGYQFIITSNHFPIATTNVNPTSATSTTDTDIFTSEAHSTTASTIRFKATTSDDLPSASSTGCKDIIPSTSNTRSTNDVIIVLAVLLAFASIIAIVLMTIIIRERLCKFGSDNISINGHSDNDGATVIPNGVYDVAEDPSIYHEVGTQNQSEVVSNALYSMEIR